MKGRVERAGKGGNNEIYVLAEVHFAQCEAATRLVWRTEGEKHIYLGLGFPFLVGCAFRRGWRGRFGGSVDVGSAGSILCRNEGVCTVSGHMSVEARMVKAVAVI